MMNKDFKMAKQEYEQIVASKNLRKNVEILFEKPKKSAKLSQVFGVKGKSLQWGLSSVAVVLMGFIVILNTNEAFAKTVSNISGMEKVVQILTGGKYEVDNNYQSASIVTPQVTGLKDKEFEERLNQEFKENAEVIINTFEKEIKQMQEEGVEGHLGVNYGYEVITDNEDILVLDVYVVNTVASSFTQHKFYNIDKKNNHLITLKEWVKDEEYIEKINQYIKEEIKKREEENGYSYFWHNEWEFKTITEETKFYINANGNVVISFEKYEIAPGAYGNVEFEIPNEIFSVQDEKI